MIGKLVLASRPFRGYNYMLKILFNVWMPSKTATVPALFDIYNKCKPWGQIQTINTPVQNQLGTEGWVTFSVVDPDDLKGNITIVFSMCTFMHPADYFFQSAFKICFIVCMFPGDLMTFMLLNALPVEQNTL